MSYDRQIDQVCQHLVVNEAVFVGSDQQTLRPLRAIASGANVRVYLNGTLEVPSTGVFTAPSLLGTRPGPFTIREGVNDFFQVRVNQGATLRQATVPASSRISSEQLVRLLNSAISGVVFFVQDNKIGLRGNTLGRSSSLFVTQNSTLAATLGFAANREVRGKDVCSGWYLVTPPRQLDDRPSRYIFFDKPLRASGEFAEITYTTLQQDCRRCGGSGVENDWRYTTTGDVVEARDEALLIQECLKIIYTEAGSNPFHTWYGTRLVDQLGQKVGVGSLIQNLIASDVHQAFSRWQSIKRQQEIAIGQEVTDSEYPYRLLSVGVERSQSDPTVFFVNITVQNRSQDPLVLSRGIRLPENLLDPGQGQGIFQQSLQQYTLSG